MSSSQFGGQSTPGLPDSGSSANQGHGGLPLNVNIFKSLTDRRATRDDNSAPKRRGPKPDSKPALTRRQELNRQAQRTHRERKELYVKTLEDEVLRLKEIYTGVSQEKHRLAEENAQLKSVLAQHGIPVPEMSRRSPPDDGSGTGHDNPYGSAASNSGRSYAVGSQSAFSPGSGSAPGSVTSSGPRPSPQPMAGNQLRDMTQQATTNKGYDYEQAGIDFVLTLERPCMTHLPILLNKVSATEGMPIGHALMASCPPQPFNAVPHSGSFPQYAHSHGDDCAHSDQSTWDIPKGDLCRLLDLSAKLDLDGEITPIKAWGMIVGHPQFLQLRESDIRTVANLLSNKVRCYGFGAVAEEFEVRDAIEGALAQAQVC